MGHERKSPCLTALAAALGLAACSTSPRLAIDSGDAGFDRSSLSAIARDVADGGENLHSLIVERRGQVVLELYRNGWNTSMSAGGGLFDTWRAMGPETIHDFRSGTKSVLGLLAGIVLARHPEYSVHSRIADFPELAAKAPSWAQSLEMRDFLTMSSGLAWKEWGRGTFTSDETRLGLVRDPLRYVLDRPLAHPPGGYFNYSGGSTFVVSRMLELIDGRSIEEIARTELLEPLGIVDWKWGKGWNGYYLPNAGLGLRSRDMLKLGELMLARGEWRGRRIVPVAWIDEATSPLLRVQTNYFDLDDKGTSYGYFWWNGSVDWLGEGVSWYSTVGNGGQKVFVVPAKDLVVVMTAGDYGKPAIQLWETALLKRILAAMS